MTTGNVPFQMPVDVAVIGAGPAGSATARRLALRGFRVVLVERSRFDVPRVGESLAPAVQPLLAELGVWDEFLALGPQPSYGTRSLWGQRDVQTHSHLVSPWGCGWHVDRVAFDRMLANAAGRAGARLLCDTAPVRCVRSSGMWELTLLEHDRRVPAGRRLCRLRADVLVDATGRGARLAPWLGASRLPLDRLVAVVTSFEGFDTSREGYVMVEASADGWWYSAAVPDGRMMVMLMTDSDLCRRNRLTSPPEWLRQLAISDATRARVAGGRAAWGPRVFSAVSQRLRRSGRLTPWIAVGDAALAVDPISGSGVVRALRSARAGAEVAAEMIVTRKPDAIEEYEMQCDSACGAFLGERTQYYGLEQRWPESTFWLRRAEQRRARTAANGVRPHRRHP